MANRRNIEVVVKVKDAASAGLDKVKNKVRDTGKAASDASVDFTRFNKTLFTTAAFIGTFAKLVTSLKESLDVGADLDRLSNQYERVLGPKGKLFESLHSLTTTSISRFEAMRAGLQLSSLGIADSGEEVATIIAKAGTAAKLAGLDSAEGVDRFTKFLKTGSIENLEFLNLLTRTNPALQAQLTILNKTGGIMGGVLSTQQKLRIGMQVLDAAVAGNMNQVRDLKDVMISLSDAMDWNRKNIGRFIGTALAPLIDSFSSFLYKVGDAVDKIRKSDKTLLFLTKTIIVTTGAVLGLVSALGTLSLLTKLLGFAGIGLPGLLTGLVMVTLGFRGLTSSVDSIMDRLRLLGGFIQGIWQLMTSLDPSTGFAKMDKSLYDMLRKNGLLTLAQNIARIGSVIKTVVEDSVNAITFIGKTIDDIFGGAFRSVVKMLDVFKNAWSNWWINDSISPIQKFGRAAITILTGIFAFIAGKKLFGLFQGLLSKVPIIGKFFGSGGGKNGGPKGTPDDPIYTKSANGVKDLLDASGSLATANIGLLKNIGGMLKAGVGVAGAGALGYAIGTGINDAINKNFASTNKYGQTYNPIEKLFGKLLMSKEQYEDTYGTSTNGVKTTTMVPSMPQSEVQVVDALGDQLKALEGDKRKKFRENIESALASGTPGNYVSPQEWRDMMVTALDSSDNLTILANKAQETKSSINTQSRR